MNDDLNIKKWYRLDGNYLNNPLFDTLLSDISKTEEKLKFYIGADSHYSYNKVIYSVVLVMLKEGRGGRGYYCRMIDNGKTTTRNILCS